MQKTWIWRASGQLIELSHSLANTAMAGLAKGQVRSPGVFAGQGTGGASFGAGAAWCTTQLAASAFPLFESLKVQPAG